MNASSLKSKTILQSIADYKLQEVAQRKKRLSLAILQKQIKTAPVTKNFLAALRQNPAKPSLIAEVKKASPSKGVIRANFEPVAIAQAYERGGATCLSVLTDEKFFQGSFSNLRKVRQGVKLPLLCKEFIIDPYQIYLARVNGADAILSIAAILSDEKLTEFMQIARSLSLTALVEVHTLAELDRVLALPDVELIGINNRNLQDFSVDLQTTKSLLEQRQTAIKDKQITVVSESGLYTPADLASVAQAGASAVLVGESLVKQTDLERAVKDLLDRT